MINALNHVLFVFGQDYVTYAEILGFITGLWCVYLIVRERVGNFPVGIANSAFFLVLFLHAKLYADGYLQIMYIVLGFVGWLAWLKAGPGGGELNLTSGTFAQLIWSCTLVILITLVLLPILSHAHDIAPFWDSLTTGLSVAAQLLLNAKKLQNWFFWMAADLIYIPLYLVKDLYLTSLVYVAFLALCVMGLRQWYSHYRVVSDAA